jgi:putative acetyltransferase
MHIRDYTDADLEVLVQIFTDAVHRTAADAYDAAQRLAWAPIPADLDVWRRRFGELHTLVAYDVAVRGFVSYRPDGYIDLLFTAPDQARRGVASRLLREVERRLLERGTCALHTKASKIARPLFEKHGFSIESIENVARSGVMLTRYAMRKVCVSGN